MTEYQDMYTWDLKNTMISLSDRRDDRRLYIRHSNSWLRLD
jgi:hypothetical protein